MMPRPPSGFTLIETIVALVLLQIAMLALAATAGVAARDLSDALVRRRAFAIATNRAERLRPQACISPSSGVNHPGPGMMESWWITEVGRARGVTDSVSVALTRGGRTAAVVRVWVLCAG